MQRPLEEDLLDLIEGRLAPDRVEVVRAALSADAQLVARVERMVADRRAIVELQRVTVAASDRARSLEAVRAAIAASEAAALFTPQFARRPRRISALAAGLGMVAAAGVLAAGVTWYLLAESRATQLADQKKVDASAGSRMTESPEASSPPVPGQGVLAPGESLADSAAVATMPSWINMQRDEHARSAVQAWTQEAERELRRAEPSESAAVIAERTLARLDSGGSARLSLEEAAALAMSRPIRLVVQASGLDWSRKRAEIFGSASRSAAGDAVSVAADQALPPDGLAIELNAPLDPERTGLRDALDELARRYAGPTGEDAWFELDRASEGSIVLPSLKLNDVLWWSNAPATWRAGLSLRVRIDPEEAPDQPGK